jgi:L-arabinose isomerase
MMKDFANMLGIEFVHINKETTLSSLEEKLLVSDLVWKLR